ncbi:MAG TPA: GntR family transcriptional regulator [Solirubrobacteraceae bacterium]|nr:GntR family transcriptional regulator [Solirubrobacteraceae bacterium]
MASNIVGRALPSEPPAAASDGVASPSLVDSAEDALHAWLAGGRYRQGDRLPPEHEVAAMLGVSRGTLRSALERLENRGEIIRRQGSGTFVGRVVTPGALGERLERLEPYSSLAARRGLKLTCRDMVVERRPVGSEVAEALGLSPVVRATTISRTLVADASPVAVMFDVVHPNVDMPSDDDLRDRLERGQMVLDVLIAEGVPVTYARTRVMPQLISPRELSGKQLGVDGPTAVLQLEELIYAGRDQRVAYSRDLFAQGGLDVMVVRSLESTGPAPVVARATRSRGRPSSAGSRTRRSG